MRLQQARLVFTFAITIDYLLVGRFTRNSHLIHLWYWNFGNRDLIITRLITISSVSNDHGQQKVSAMPVIYH